ncbi:sensor histidine kinase [Streptomyces sp. NPDC048507]|uniref:sensor histidine kinase n=1 Tax=Streptomyces sp. NPDC048507 TaxID=3365560 RepID=UPI00371D832C
MITTAVFRHGARLRQLLPSPATAAAPPHNDGAPPKMDRRRSATLKRFVTGALPPLAAVADAYAVSALHTATEVALSITATGALLLRHKAPEVALLLTLPACLFGYTSLATLIALYSVAAHRAPAVIGWAGAAATAFVPSLCSASWSDPFPVNPADLPETYLTSCCLSPVVAVVLGRSIRAQRERVREVLTRRELENQLLTERVLASERARLAREMHDIVSHKVSLISLQAGALQVGRPGAVDVEDSARLIQELSAQTVTELHHMLGILRTTGDSTAAPSPEPGLTDLAQLCRATSLPVCLRMPEEWAGVPRGVERAAYRTVQEALTNIRKHAPGARTTVTVTVSRSAVRVEVSNEAGHPPLRDMPGSGQGLLGLTERARLLDGHFAAGPRHGGGFQVVAVYPLVPGPCAQATG